MNTILERLGAHFEPKALASWLATVLPRLLVALLILIAFYLLWRGVDRGLRALRERLDATVLSFVRSISKFALLTAALVMGLAELGINIASLLAGLGIAGLTIGFAARDALSNIISGLFIFWDRPFTIGDLIEVSGQYGKVEDITLRSTRVVTVDGKMLAVPNSTIVNSTVASYTNFPNLRLDVKITVGTGEDLGQIRQLFTKLVEGDARYLGDPAPAMVLLDVGDYNLSLEFRVWLVNERQHVSARFELREKLFEVFRAAGVDMPLQTLQLAPVPVTMQKAA
jgi:small conductance mechanosensitive channel